MDLGEGSLMTNATFATMQAQGADHTIVVTYKGEQETVPAPEGTPIMASGPLLTASSRWATRSSSSAPRTTASLPPAVPA